MTAAGIVSEPMEIHKIGSGRERHERVRDLLATVGLDPDYGDRYPHEFSGGQRQRIGVARALALHPDLIVADEPISALDVSIQAQIINLLEKLQGEFGLTYLFIAHDLSVVRHISDRIVVMYLGRVVEIAGSRELYERPLHPYSVALLSAVPIPDPAVESRRRRIILTGDVPEPVEPALRLHASTLVAGFANASETPSGAWPRHRNAGDGRPPRGRLPFRRGGRRHGGTGPGDRPARKSFRRPNRGSGRSIARGAHGARRDQTALSRAKVDSGEVSRGRGARRPSSARRRRHGRQHGSGRKRS